MKVKKWQGKYTDEETERVSMALLASVHILKWNRISNSRLSIVLFSAFSICSFLWIWSHFIEYFQNSIMMATLLQPHEFEFVRTFVYPSIFAFVFSSVFLSVFVFEFSSVFAIGDDGVTQHSVEGRFCNQRQFNSN